MNLRNGLLIGIGAAGCYALGHYTAVVAPPVGGETASGTAEERLVRESAATAQNRDLLQTIESALAEPNSRKRLKRLRQIALTLDGAQIALLTRRLASEKDPALRNDLLPDLVADWAARDPRSAAAFAESLELPFHDRALAMVAQSWAEADEAAATAWIATLPNGSSRRAARQGLGQAIGQKDLPRLVAMIEEKPGDWPLDQLRGVWSYWVGKNPRAAIEAAMRLPKQPRDQALESIVSAWGSVDPEAAFSWARELPPGRFRFRALNDLGSALAQRNPQEAIRLVMGELPPGPQRDETLLLAARQLAAQMDRAGALAWVEEQVPEGLTRDQAVAAVLQHWAKEDPRAALEYASGLPRVARDPAIRSIIGQWAEDDPKALLERVSGLSASDRSFAISSAIEQWARNDPKAALDYALDLPAGSARTNALSRSIAAWVGDDYDAGSRWLGQNAGKLPFDLVSVAADSLAFQAPEKAFELIASLPEGSARRGTLYQFLGTIWGNRDPARAKAQLEKMAAGPERDQFLQGYVGALSQRDPEAAQQLVFTLPEGSAREEAIRKIAGSQASDDPAEALRWAAKLSDGAARDGTIGSIVRQWANADSQAAGDYLNRLPAGMTRDAAVAQFARVIGREDPEGAVLWAASIDDPKKREQGLNGAVRAWTIHDPAAARAWVEKSSQPREWKDKMLHAK